jgi:ribosome-associated translation inhibitor RaiA
MDLTFTGRGLPVTDEVREVASHKLAPLERKEPRTTRIDLEFIGEHYPRLDGVTRVEAALHIPRKTFRAHA